MCLPQVQRSLKCQVELKHPSIVTFIGDSREPGRQEVLCVSAYIDYGTLSTWIGNSTIELEPEMVLSVIKVRIYVTPLVYNKLPFLHFLMLPMSR